MRQKAANKNVCIDHEPTATAIKMINKETNYIYLNNQNDILEDRLKIVSTGN